VVVGAGPAGSSAAESLVKKGFKTILLEKKNFSQSKVCGGLLPASVLKEFDVPLKVILRRLKGYRVYLPNNETVIFNFKDEGATTDRNLLDSFLANRAQDAGAELIGNAQAIDVKIERAKAKVAYKKAGKIHEVSSQVVIAADGIGSKMAMKILGNIYEKRNLALGYQVNFPILDDSSYFDVFISETIGYGLGWLSPKLETATLGVGIGLYRSKTIKKIFYDHISERRQILAEKIDLNREISREVAVLPLDKFVSKAYSDRFLIVGDAALLVNPFSGDGIYYALKSGRMAADTVEKAYERDSFSEESLKDYQILLEREFEDVFDFCLKVHKRFYKYPERLAFIVKDSKGMYEFLEDCIWSKTRKKVSLRQKIGLDIAYSIIRLNQALRAFSRSSTIFRDHHYASIGHSDIH